jgi:SAM-dependent methyltransferase
MDNADSNPSSSAAAEAQNKFSSRQVFVRHWRQSVRYFGVARSLWELADALWRAMLELLPSHRQARFGDLDYDWENSVNTTRSNVGFGAQLLAELAGRPYFASDPWLFEQMMEALAVKFEDFTFIDLGSGKGRALLMAAPYEFKKIIGVEFMPAWHKAAEANIRKYVAAKESAPSMESVCVDARDFEFPVGPLVIYLFNPFPEPVFVAVMERLRRSWLESPRPILIAYRYTEFERLLQKLDWLERVAGTEQWAVYKLIHHADTHR